MLGKTASFLLLALVLVSVLLPAIQAVQPAWKWSTHGGDGESESHSHSQSTEEDEEEEEPHGDEPG